MINHYFGGNISQDRLSYYVFGELYRNNYKPPETDLGHGWGLGVGVATEALSWTLNGAEICHEGYPDPWPFPKPSLEQIKQWIDSGRPILRQWLAHYTVIDGYDGEYLHVINPWTGTESRIHYNDLDIYNRWIPPSNATARNDEPEIWMDSDSDGVVDFDETRRFFTDPYSNDTDKDGIPDKIEIRSYTFLSNDTFDSEDIRKPDADGDGLRAELDPDSDNGGAPDGLEDLNHNGKLDPGETDPFDPSDDPIVQYPVATFDNQPKVAWVNETITFNATQSHSPNGNITSYTWNFGDENVTTTQEAIINYTFSKEGRHIVTLEITDEAHLRASISNVVNVTRRTDLNKDGTVNIMDIAIVAKAYGSKTGDPKWNPIADVAEPYGEINILDTATVAKDYGKTA
jgi:hypothetical protein